MASLQTIVDNATYITFDTKKVAAQSISRSGRLLTSELASANPYRITVGMHQGLKYSENRDLLQDLDGLDITEETTIDIGGTNTGLSYVTEYKGGITSGNMTAVGFNGKDLYVNASGCSGSGTLVKKGDFIQPAGNTSTYRYPYQVTSDVSFSTGSNVTIPVHRPVIAQDGVALTSGNIKRGTDVDWKVKMLVKPKYSIVPHDRIAFDEDFELIEVVRKDDG